MSVELANAIVGVLDLGSLYALVGVGFVILYRSTRVFNFAQGAFMLVGGDVFFTLLVDLHLPWYVALPASMAALAIVGALVYLLFFRRLVGADLFVLVIATLGLNVVIITIATIIWGPNTRSLPQVLSLKPLFSLGNLSFARLDLFSIGLAAIVILLLARLLQRSRLGTQMRAVADGPLLASQTRISVHTVSAVAWAIAALCAGGAGVMYSLRVALDPAGIPSLGLLAFPALFLGGLDSIQGALAGGFLLALAQNATTYFISGLWSNVVAYAILLVVLLVRPRGIFGSREVVRL